MIFYCNQLKKNGRQEIFYYSMVKSVIIFNPHFAFE
jgi:hypothetical protein